MAENVDYRSKPCYMEKLSEKSYEKLYEKVK